MHYNWIYCASPKVFQKKSQKLINKKTRPAHTRASGCVWLLCSLDIQLQGSIMWDFCLKTDSLRASKPNFDMQQILFLPFHRLNPYLSLLLVNAFRFIEALHLCHSLRTNPVKALVPNCEGRTAETAYQCIQGVLALRSLRGVVIWNDKWTFIWWRAESRGSPSLPLLLTHLESRRAAEQPESLVTNKLKSVMTTTRSGHQRFYAGESRSLSSWRCEGSKVAWCSRAAVTIGWRL